MTNSKDWHVDFGDTVMSPDQSTTGIVDVHSNSDKVSAFDGTPYNTWLTRLRGGGQWGDRPYFPALKRTPIASFKPCTHLTAPMLAPDGVENAFGLRACFSAKISLPGSCSSGRVAVPPLRVWRAHRAAPLEFSWPALLDDRASG